MSNDTPIEIQPVTREELERAIAANDDLSAEERKQVEQMIRKSHAPGIISQAFSLFAVIMFLGALGIVGWLIYELIRAADLLG